MGEAVLTLTVLLILAGLVMWLLSRGKLRSKTRTRSFLGIRASVRGLLDVRSIYIPLGFGYRWELFKAKTERERAARERREGRR